MRSFMSLRRLVVWILLSLEFVRENLSYATVDLC